MSYIGEGDELRIHSILDSQPGSIAATLPDNAVWSDSGPNCRTLLTELVIALVVRTRYVFFRSRPGKWLLVSILVIIGLTLVLPYLPVNTLFGFVPRPAPLMLTLLGLTALYMVMTELAKKYFYSRN